MYPKEINDIQERFFRQAYETLYDNLNNLKGGETMSAFNHTVNNTGLCPTLTTRCEGFKTAILIIERSSK